MSGNPSDKPLRGVRICIDPGHGGNSYGAGVTINGQPIREKDLALTISLMLRDKLVEAGASVTMSRTGDTNPSMDSRVDMARNNGTDMLLSIHIDGGGGSGGSVHYFNEYSYEAAGILWEKMHEVEKKYGIGNRAEPVHWSPFQLARCHDTTAFLVECGFMDNSADREARLNPVDQNLLTTAMTDGIIEYFQSRPVLAAAQNTSVPVSAPPPAPAAQPALPADSSVPVYGRRRSAAVYKDVRAGCSDYRGKERVGL